MRMSGHHPGSPLPPPSAPGIVLVLTAISVGVVRLVEAGVRSEVLNEDVERGVAALQNCRNGQVEAVPRQPGTAQCRASTLDALRRGSVRRASPLKTNASPDSSSKRVARTGSRRWRPPNWKRWPCRPATPTHRVPCGQLSAGLSRLRPGCRPMRPPAPHYQLIRQMSGAKANPASRARPVASAAHAPGKGSTGAPSLVGTRWLRSV